MRRPPVRAVSSVPAWPRVALIVETSLAPGREILRGVARFVREKGPWSIAHEPRSLEQSVPRWLRRWRGEGIIARVSDQKLARAIAAAGVPTVDVLGVIDGLPFPLVHVDDEAIGRLGAEHLLDIGFRRFGFFGIEGENWSHRRSEAFARRVQAAGCSCLTFTMSRQTARQERWEDSERELAAWLAALPKPAGLMIASDQLGPHTLEACRAAGVVVPDDLGVIGVDNDGPLCEVSDPPLSSVWPDHRRVGYEAAQLLSQLMQGAPAPRNRSSCRRARSRRASRRARWRSRTARSRRPCASSANRDAAPSTSRTWCACAAVAQRAAASLPRAARPQRSRRDRPPAPGPCARAAAGDGFTAGRDRGTSRLPPPGIHGRGLPPPAARDAGLVTPLALAEVDDLYPSSSSSSSPYSLRAVWAEDGDEDGDGAPVDRGALPIRTARA